MEVRPAELEDLRDCMALSASTPSNHVWQLTLGRDPAASLETSEFNIALRCLRLPRQIVVEPPGDPLETIWHRAAAVFVATDETETLGGFVALTIAHERPAAMIERLVVAPSLRRHGIASALARMAARWAASEGLDGLTAHCSARNHPAVAFYMRVGFALAGYSEAYYPRGEVALFWQRPVSGPAQGQRLLLA